MALASYPGFFMTSPPSGESQFGVYWPTLVPSAAVEQRVVIGEESIADPAGRSAGERSSRRRPPAAPRMPRRRAARRARCRSARSAARARATRAATATSASGCGRRRPTAGSPTTSPSTRFARAHGGGRATLEVDRFELPNLLALNFVVKGLLGDGVAASLRSDPQAKSLGEYLRAKVVPIPIALL